MARWTTDLQVGATIAGVVSACAVNYRRKLVFVMKNGDVISGYSSHCHLRIDREAEISISGTISIDDGEGKITAIDASEVMGVRPE